MMKKKLFYCVIIALSIALLLSSCKKDEIGKNGEDGTETPSESANQEYPSTANVIPHAVTDIDGNIYDAVQIGDQVWMAENLRTTRYANGDTIELGGVMHNTHPYRYAPGASQNTEENMINVARYGYLYNWPAVVQGGYGGSGCQGICPDGWHIPSDEEWTLLTNYMKTQPMYYSMSSYNPEHLAKALSTTWGWTRSEGTDSPGSDTSTNNASGFSAPPAGEYGEALSFGIAASYWTATYYTSSNNKLAYFRSWGGAEVYKGRQYWGFGMSVRCVRD